MGIDNKYIMLFLFLQTKKYLRMRCTFVRHVMLPAYYVINTFTAQISWMLSR